MNRGSIVLIGALVLTGSIAYAAQHVIGQKGRLFRPGVMTVKVGDTVTFKNDDNVTHHIYSSTKGQEFNLTTAHPGQDARRTFTVAGTVDVRCGLHPAMRLAVTVQ